MKMRMPAPKRAQLIGAGDRSISVFEATEVRRVAVVKTKTRAGVEQDDGIVTRELAIMRRSNIAPEILRTFRPVGGAVNRAAVEEKRSFRMGRSDARFLLDLKAIHLPLRTSAAFEVELVPAGVEQRVDLRRGFRHERETIGMLGSDGSGDDRLARAGPARDHDPLHCDQTTVRRSSRTA